MIKHELNKTEDSIQKRLTEYAIGLTYGTLTPEAVHGAKVRLIDTLGALFGGFFAEPCRIARNLAAQMLATNGVTVLGTRMKTFPDMAAFVNATTARFVEMNDGYHWPGSAGGHPSDVITPVLGAAEHVGASGRELIASIALAYEVYLRISDVFPHRDFDQTNFCCLATAVAAGKLFKLSAEQMAHCISMAIVPNNILRQVRMGHLSMFKAAASGQAGRAGIFAAMLARAGMEGPHLPFEGKAGWCEHIARKRIVLDAMGGPGVPFKVESTLIKLRPSCGTTQSSLLAAEKIALRGNTKFVKHVLVEAYKKAKLNHGTEELNWNPQSRETADHSIPYVVAVALTDGIVTPRSFNDERLWDPQLRALIQKIEVVENPEFTAAYVKVPVVHRTRVTVTMENSERVVGETGGGPEDFATPRSDAQIEEKFRMLSEESLGARRCSVVLNRLWRLDENSNVADIPPMLVLD